MLCTRMFLCRRSGIVSFLRNDKQIMGLELLAVVFGLEVFLPYIKGRVLRIWTDNEGCLWSVLKGGAKEADHNELVHRLWTTCHRYQMTPWFERVPSAENLSDGPTRLDYSVVEYFGARRISAQEPRVVFS